MYSISPPMWCLYGTSRDDIYQALLFVEYVGIFQMDDMQIVGPTALCQISTGNNQLSTNGKCWWGIRLLKLNEQQTN